MSVSRSMINGHQQQQENNSSNAEGGTVTTQVSDGEGDRASVTVTIERRCTLCRDWNGLAISPCRSWDAICAVDVLLAP